MDIKTQFYQIQLKTIDLSPHVFFFLNKSGPESCKIEVYICILWISFTVTI